MDVCKVVKTRSSHKTCTAGLHRLLQAQGSPGPRCPRGPGVPGAQGFPGPRGPKGPQDARLNRTVTCVRVQM